MSGMVENKQEVNAIYDSGNYMEVFEQDLVEAEKEVVISSPSIIQDKIDRLIYLMKPRQEVGVKITVIIQNPENVLCVNVAFVYSLINQMKNAAIHVQLSEKEIEHFAVIDNSLVWHGGMNLLGKEDIWDNLIRVKNVKVAAELMEMTFANFDC
jgi:hypothetical protein